MTDAAVNVEIGSQPTGQEAPAGHYYSTMKDRKILIKDINPAQSMVLGGYLRQIKGEVDYEKITDIFGRLMQLVENLVVESDDLAWMETQILIGNLNIEDFASIFHSHTATAKPVAAKKPRRGK